MTTRYSREELRTMARRSLAARDSHDSRWTLLVLRLALHFEVQPASIEQHIVQLAAD